MAGQIRIEMNSTGVVELLKSAEVQADLLRRGEAMQRATGSPDDFDVLPIVGRQRAAVYVSTKTVAGMLAEAEDRALTRAVDAGRD